MQCNNCNHKVMCKHYSYALTNVQIGLIINNCKLYQSEHSDTIMKEISKESTVCNKNFTNKYTDFSSISNINSISAIPVEINKVICDRCKTEVYSTDINNCIECSRPICGNCSVNTFNPETGEVVATCENCWSGASDPVSGEEKDIKISYSTEGEKEDWNLIDFSKMKEEVKEDVKSESMDNKPSNRKSKKK